MQGRVRGLGSRRAERRGRHRERHQRRKTAMLSQFTALSVPLNWNASVQEDAVELDFRERLSRYGEWNDATNDQGYEMVRAPRQQYQALLPLIDWSWVLAVPALRDAHPSTCTRLADELGHGRHGQLPRSRLVRPQRPAQLRCIHAGLTRRASAQRRSDGRHHVPG